LLGFPLSLVRSRSGDPGGFFYFAHGLFFIYWLSAIIVELVDDVLIVDIATYAFSLVAIADVLSLSSDEVVEVV
jgi:hypothetical protein